MKFISKWISSKVERLCTVNTFLAVMDCGLIIFVRNLKIPAIVVSSTSTTLRSYYTLVTFSLNGNFGNTGWLLPSKPPFLLLEHVQKSAPGVHRVVVSKGDTKHTSVNQKSYPLLETQVRLEFEVLNFGWKCDILSKINIGVYYSIQSFSMEPVLV